MIDPVSFRHTVLDRSRGSSSPSSLSFLPSAFVHNDQPPPPPPPQSSQPQTLNQRPVDRTITEKIIDTTQSVYSSIQNTPEKTSLFLSLAMRSDENDNDPVSSLRLSVQISKTRRSALREWFRINPHNLLRIYRWTLIRQVFQQEVRISFSDFFSFAPSVASLMAIAANFTPDKAVDELGWKYMVRSFKAVNDCYKLLNIDLDGVFQRLSLLQKKNAALIVEDGGKTKTEVKCLDMKRREYCVLSKNVSQWVVPSRCGDVETGAYGRSSDRLCLTRSSLMKRRSHSRTCIPLGKPKMTSSLLNWHIPVHVRFPASSGNPLVRRLTVDDNRIADFKGRPCDQDQDLPFRPLDV